jgi:hypothetical protein
MKEWGLGRNPGKRCPSSPKSNRLKISNLVCGVGGGVKRDANSLQGDYIDEKKPVTIKPDKNAMVGPEGQVIPYEEFRRRQGGGGAEWKKMLKMKDDPTICMKTCEGCDIVSAFVSTSRSLPTIIVPPSLAISSLARVGGNPQKKEASLNCPRILRSQTNH